MLSAGQRTATFPICLSLCLSLLSHSFFAASVFHFALAKCPANFNITFIKCEFDFLYTHIPQSELYMSLYVNCLDISLELNAKVKCCNVLHNAILKPALNKPKGTSRTSVCLFLYKCSTFRTLCMKMNTCQWEQCKGKSLDNK